jgi:WD40 repeat protein
MQFSADGRRLVSCSGDQTLRLWDVAGRALLRTFRGHKTAVWRLALLPDQRTVVSGGKDGAVLLWELETERAPTATGKLDTKQRAWAFADGGQAIVTVDAVGEATRWVFAANHPRLAGVTPENKIRVWDWASRTMLREISPPPDTRSVRPVRFADDASELAVVVAADEKNSVRVWEITTGRETGGFPLAAQSWRVGDYAGYRDRQWLAVQRTGQGGMLFSRQDVPSVVIDFNFAQVRQPAFSPDGRTVAVPDTGGFVRLLDGNSFQEAAKLSGYMHGVHSLGFSADGSRLATGGTATEAITVWDMGSRERLLTIGARESIFARTAFSPDGHVLVAESGTGPTAGTLYFWRAPSWAEIEQAEAAERAGAGR